MTDTTDKPPSEWMILGTALWQRFWKPYSRPAAVAYLLLGVMAMGGLSTWVTYVLFQFGKTTPRDVAVSIATYVVAVLCTALADLILEVGPTNLLKFILFSLAVIVTFITAYVTYRLVWVVDKSNPAEMSIWSLLGCVVPMWAIWWLANGSDQRFITNTDPQIAAGGDPTRSIS